MRRERCVGFSVKTRDRHRERERERWKNVVRMWERSVQWTCSFSVHLFCPIIYYFHLNFAFAMGLCSKSIPSSCVRVYSAVQYTFYCGCTHIHKIMFYDSVLIIKILSQAYQCIIGQKPSIDSISVQLRKQS